MQQDLPSDKEAIVPRLGGLDERNEFSKQIGPDFDALSGFIHQRDGILQRANGTKLLQSIPGKKILSICQTFDNRKNVLVQTDGGVYLFSEDELVGRVIPTALTPVTINEEETMSRAVIVHALALTNNGGNYPVANVWQDAPVSAILFQRNPDGTAAAFVTAIATPNFTLAVGSYRISGWSMHTAAAGNRCKTRLFNTTSGLPVWNGADNEDSPALLVDTVNGNTQLPFAGEITIAVPTQFKIQNFCTALSANGFGFARNIGHNELYRFIDIIKTA
jgi:hypothetical protein